APGPGPWTSAGTASDWLSSPPSRRSGSGTWRLVKMARSCAPQPAGLPGAPFARTGAGWRPAGTGCASGAVCAAASARSCAAGRGGEAAARKEGPAVPDLFWSPDGRYVAELVPGRLRVWDGAAGTEVFRLDDAAVRHRLAFSPDSQHIALARTDRTVVVLDV